MKILLTSAGFINKRIEQAFLDIIDKPPNEAKVLFIPTAASNVGAILVLPKCINELLTAGISEKNIDVYNFHTKISSGMLRQYDVIYVTGGVTKYLLSRINETGFQHVLKEFIADGGIYVGVSAGSIAITNTFHDSLGYINCTLHVHQDYGSPSGAVDMTNCPKITLTDNQAILVVDGGCRIIE